MTWQHIDDDIYIDDTLVTCAEYQLFIDEMREQGQYYQPDHWITYQFKMGMALQPILGVRHLDAIMFCEWLNNRDIDGWYFRLPVAKEAAIYCLKSFSPPRAGYWLSREANQLPALSWDGGVPVNARDLTNVFSVNLSAPLDLEKYRFLVKSDNVRSAKIDLESYLQRDLNVYKILGKGIDTSFSISADLYMDLFTLHERIAGRSPAFEGIRLVKERIK